MDASTGGELGMARWRSVNHPEVEEVVEQVRQVYDVSILPPHILWTRLRWPGGSDSSGL